MDNQHRKITGYRELNLHEIVVMNEIKDASKRIGFLVEILRGDETIDQRWVSIGATDLQKGFMALARAVENPESF